MDDLPDLGRVLVVDDDENVRRLLAVKLARAGARVVLAPDVPAALLAVRGEPPELVIYGNDHGDGAVRELRAALIAFGAHSPGIVVLSDRRGAAAVRGALDAGADDYVTRPFSPEELVHRLVVVAARRSLAPDGRDTTR